MAPTMACRNPGCPRGPVAPSCPRNTEQKSPLSSARRAGLLTPTPSAHHFIFFTELGNRKGNVASACGPREAPALALQWGRDPSSCLGSASLPSRRHGGGLTLSFKLLFQNLQPFPVRWLFPDLKQVLQTSIDSKEEIRNSNSFP